MLRAIIIDDIDTIRAKNMALIKKHCPNVAIIAEANDVKSGVEVIRKYLPDLVFLDIEMPDGTGFNLLQQLRPVNFKVIFITGFQDFAIKAFRFSAIDYLLKPIDPTDLIEAVKKAEDSVTKEAFDIRLSTLFTNIERPKDLQKLVLKTMDKIYSVNVQDIVNCESDRNYTTFFFINAPKLVVSTTLKEYDTLLSPLGFFRTHQSHLINMMYFDHLLKSDGGSTIILKNKSTIPLAVRKRDEFMALLETL
ncbi:LytR/AlgR family response regulator transcription factor [Flavobacterium silvaticum]|uniref:Response regulator transcription factor n=1 Tax=Flavobacterium silvaticum TaxID=1852020 RepID=A0A972FZE9_9FLAO|nr:LytTR family DNA-binding domain-containing protein [Flavobacterium silvaticum]NMH27606.1 response regulator transcription factor [Flavobacterium silvaticum]